ncbi:MAG: ABC transporter permease [Trueperaceae bacterium]
MSIFSYIARRTLLAIPTVLVIVTLLFLLVRVIPGDAAIAALGENATEEALAALRNQFGLDRPLWEQYFEYMGNLLQGDLGVSLATRRPVGSLLAANYQYTLDLMLGSLVVAIVMGIPTGIYSAVNRGRAADGALRIVSLLGISTPPFYLGVLLLLLFSVQLSWFPVLGAGDLSDPVERLKYLVLPAITGGIGIASYLTRVTRSAMLNVLGEDYLRTAVSKGVRPHMVTYKHALRNALIPVVTVIGIYVTVLIGNAVLIEIVFSRPGFGRLLVGSVLQRDYYTIQSVMAVFAMVVVVTNLIIDIVYVAIDPRVNYG